jgi:hypothetical protein
MKSVMSILKRVLTKSFSSYYFLVFLLPACANEKLPKYTVLQGLRVLALQADLPEVNFNGATFSDTVQLIPVVSDLYGSGRALKYNFQVCLDLGIALGAIPNCEGNPTQTILASNQSVTSATGSFKTPNYSGTVDPVSINLSTAFSVSALGIISSKFLNAATYEQFNGLNLILYYELFPDGDEALMVKAFKRLVFSSSAKAVKNANPTGLAIQDESGVEIIALPTVESKLQADLPSVSAESYSLMDDDGLISIKTERLETTWFLTGNENIADSKDKEKTTDGLFLLSRTLVGELNTFYPPQVSTPTARGRVLIGIARDDRGGITTKRYVDGLD